MSSTNRGSVREVSDYYVTPQLAIHKFLLAWPEFYSLIPSRVLDPCAGGSTLDPRMSYPEVLSRFSVVCDTIDIRPDSSATIIGDYLQLDCMGLYDLIITNPPFSHALEIAEKAIREVRPDGFVVLLLRLNFFGSRKRFQFWQRFPPYAVFVHSQRMSFTGGAAASIEYMHCVWLKGHTKHNTYLRVI